MDSVYTQDIRTRQGVVPTAEEVERHPHLQREAPSRTAPSQGRGVIWLFVGLLLAIVAMVVMWIDIVTG